MSLAFFSSIIGGMLVGLAYAFGHFTQNPKFLVWAKTEVFQIAVSIVIVFAVIFMVGLVGMDDTSDFTINYGLIEAMAPESATYEYPAYL